MSEPVKEPKTFRSVSVSNDDLVEYVGEAENISEELNLPKTMSVAQYLRMAHDFYKQNRKKVK